VHERLPLETLEYVINILLDVVCGTIAVAEGASVGYLQAFNDEIRKSSVGIRPKFYVTMELIRISSNEHRPSKLTIHY
jgi:hypothetical protein